MTMLSQNTNCLGLWLALLLMPATLHAQEFLARAQAFCGNNARQVERNLVHPQRPDLRRTIRRIFVPVIPGQEHNFINTFASAQACVLFARPSTVHRVHPWFQYTRLITRNAETITSWNSTVDGGAQIVGERAMPFVAHVPGSRYVVLNLGTTALDFSLKFLATFRNPQTASMGYGIYHYLQQKQAAGRTPGDVSASCMWWLPNLETADNETLTQNLGCKRTRGPQEIPALAMHGGITEKVPIVGVAVNNIEEFRSMNEDMLFGPPPTRGEPGSWIR
ncbi:MAG: hypothetical protein V1754_07115 [Pseudomonadota bacterium]